MNFFVDAVLWSGVDELATPRFQVCFFRAGVQQHVFSQDEYQSVMKKMRGYTREGYMTSVSFCLRPSPSVSF